MRKLKLLNVQRIQFRDSNDLRVLLSTILNINTEFIIHLRPERPITLSPAQQQHGRRVLSMIRQLLQNSNVEMAQRLQQDLAAEILDCFLLSIKNERETQQQ